MEVSSGRLRRSRDLSLGQALAMAPNDPVLSLDRGGSGGSSEPRRCDGAAQRALEIDLG